MPFSKLLGIKESSSAEYLVELEYNEDLSNHLGVFHASVILSFAEVCSGCFMAKHFPEEKQTTFPMLRKLNGKFSSPSVGKLYAKSYMHNDTPSEVSFRLNMSDKVSLTIITDVFNAEEKLIFRGQFEWFVRRKDAVSPKSLLKTLSKE